MLRVHVCVESTCAPFGRRAMIGIVVGRILVAGTSVVKKMAGGARIKDGPSLDGVGIGADCL